MSAPYFIYLRNTPKGFQVFATNQRPADSNGKVPLLKGPEVTDATAIMNCLMGHAKGFLQSGKRPDLDFLVGKAKEMTQGVFCSDIKLIQNVPGKADYVIVWPL